ncbi:UNVERIFIED_CONTAM: hypothetical protein PYX00_006246 [Menopon gallinae]|uniref:Uncharacterized protein n=1 Tax=Menopon gallinae TaxID=328185 RepID=A0AAW2HUP3_9NEOP
MAGLSVWLVLLLAGNAYGFVFPSARNETKRELTSWENEELLIHLLSIKKAEVETIIQTGRKFLQKVRQWQGAHPAESRLAKCVIRYCIDTKIPGIAATADLEDDEDGRRGLSAPVWIEKPEDILSFDEGNSVTPAWNESDEEHTFKSVEDIKLKKFLWKRKAVKALYIIYVHLKDIFSQYKLFNCTFYYVLSKFWEWVDSAP